jgi:aryl-alcohol dehydrogenase-like predicted oxidoreductase
VEYRTLGRTDLKVAELCLGTMTFGWGADKETSFAIMDAAVEGGINFFDTADIYSRWAAGNPGGVAEQWIGDWLSDRKPKDIIIATKVRGPMWDGPDGEGLSRAHIMRAAEDSLRRLQIDSIGLYQTHWPDDDIPLEETLRAFDDLIQQGKVRYIGCSNYQAGFLSETLAVSAENGLARFESLQPRHNLIHREEFERELMALCQQESVGVIPYSPLAGGFLTGKYRQGIPQGTRGQANARIQGYLRDDRLVALVDRVEALSKARGKTIAQMALGWQLSLPVVTSSIIGVRTVEQLQESLGAVSFRLDEQTMRTLDELSAW